MKCRYAGGKYMHFMIANKFLFAVQVPRYAGGLGNISPNLDDLHGDTLVVRGLQTRC
jgi:hypothetical protein